MTADDGALPFWHSPVRTFDTAVVYYHKFRLAHPDGEYNYVVGRNLACLGQISSNAEPSPRMPLRQRSLRPARLKTR